MRAHPHRLALCLLGICLGLSAGCQPSESIPWFAPPRADPEFDRLAYRRSSCYGSCPEYTITVARDGTVQYWGDANVRVIGAAHAILSPAQLESLRTAVAVADLWRIESDYQNATDCPSWSMDTQGIEIIITRGAHLKSIAHDLSCRERLTDWDGTPLQGPRYPPALVVFEEQFESIVNVQQWVGP